MSGLSFASRHPNGLVSAKAIGMTGSETQRSNYDSKMIAPLTNQPESFRPRAKLMTTLANIKLTFGEPDDCHKGPTDLLVWTVTLMDGHRARISGHPGSPVQHIYAMILWVVAGEADAVVQTAAVALGIPNSDIVRIDGSNDATLE